MISFKEEFEEYLAHHPYREHGNSFGMFRYIVSGPEGKPAVVFLNGLGMQEMWLPYMKALEKNHCVLMMEYPESCSTAEQLIDSINGLLHILNIKDPVLIGASDGGVLAQLYVRRFPDEAKALILMTTVTIDSKYCDDTNKEDPKRYLRMVSLTPFFLLRKILLKLVLTYFRGESEEEQAYGTSFLQYIASDPRYKKKYIQSVRIVYDIAKQEFMDPSEFASLQGRILVIHPEDDIFTKEDQDKLSALVAEAGGSTIRLAGGHLTFVSSPAKYIDEIKTFLTQTEDIYE